MKKMIPLICAPGDVPAELRELVDALAEEYPLRKSGRGKSGQAKTICPQDERISQSS